ncbi:hypothetical protein [Umezawaea beigongshangensis]|uniref:hypothetical protein n=1 Tax=Umezawaea beigongshangensis TaxID=2780383 RepID=UPI0018F17ADB|nr:hypothetical protein [Umezawaea beigongshangensis]
MTPDDPTPAVPGPADETDPLAAVTLRPATFFALAAVTALLIGLVLALVPVHVAGPDVTRSSDVSCGSVIGGVETPRIAGDVPELNRTELLTYVDVCERGVSERETVSSVLFFGGAVAGLWMGVVRRRRT